MSYRIEEIEGIGPAKTAALLKADIKTTEQLLAAAGSKKGREQTAAATGLDTKQLLKFVNLADLMRIKGVGEEYSELLEAGGVDTVKELAHRVPANLHKKLGEVAAANPRLVRRAPNAGECAAWVAEAKTLQPMVTH